MNERIYTSNQEKDILQINSSVRPQEGMDYETYFQSVSISNINADAYRDVARVHGKGLPLAAKIGIGVGALAVAIGIVILAASKSIESAF